MQEDKDKRNIERLLKIIRSSKGGKKLGIFPKDTFEGEFSEMCTSAFLENEEFETIDISGAVAYIMCPKDEPEINNIRKAALVSMELFNKYLKDQIMEIVDSDRVTTNRSTFIYINCKTIFIINIFLLSFVFFFRKSSILN